VTLPDGADEDDISATYDRGILTVSVPLSDEPAAEKHVDVYEIALLDEDETGMATTRTTIMPTMTKPTTRTHT
jgi:Hsp20/alpha crystallin family